MKKIISIFLSILMMIQIIILPTKVKASFSIDSASLYSKGLYEGYLRYGNTGIIFNYVVYSKDGVEYPAYCLNKDMQGAEKISDYGVDVDSLIDNNQVWRAVKNGYPYKTAGEM